MEKINRFIILVVISIFFNSCIVINKKIKVDREVIKVENYYKYTNLAERAIINNDFDAATNYYRKAFKEKIPFRSDLIWAKKCSILGEKDINTIFEFLRFNKMMSSNSGLETIKYFKEEYGKENELDFCDVLIANLDTVSQRYSMNRKVISEIKSIIKKDQDIRHFCYDKGISDIYNSIYRDTIKSTDSINLKKSISIIEREAITESTVGFFVNNLSIIINHASQWGYFEWYPILLEKVKNGGLKNTVFSGIIDRTFCFGNPYIQDSIGTVYGSYQGIGLYDKYLSPIFEKSKLEKINNNRATIFLDNFEVWENKRVWTWNQDINFDLSFCPMWFDLSTPPKASKEEIKEIENQQELMIEQYLRNGNYLIKSIDNYTE